VSILVANVKYQFNTKLGLEQFHKQVLAIILPWIMSSAAVTNISAVRCSISRRSFVTAELLPGKVAADTARSPSLTLNGGGEVNWGFLATRLRVVRLTLNKNTIVKMVMIN